MFNDDQCYMLTLDIYIKYHCKRRRYLIENAGECLFSITDSFFFNILVWIDRGGIGDFFFRSFGQKKVNNISYDWVIDSEKFLTHLALIQRGSRIYITIYNNSIHAQHPSIQFIHAIKMF